MNKGFLALTLALSILPAAAIAQSAPAVVPDHGAQGAPAMTDQQRQAMFTEFKAIHTQEEALYKQYRAQMLNSITPIHRNAVAGLIGQLAISANPDKSVTAKQIDILLSGAERNAILGAHANFQAQSKKLHEQAWQELQKYLPAGATQNSGHKMHGMNGNRTQVNDPGEILLRTLSGSEGHGMRGGMFPMGPPMGQPQQR
jgi:Spy/CpxP family protein refolding chaperone